MGIEITPQGITSTLIAIASAVLVLTNRKSLMSLVTSRVQSHVPDLISELTTSDDSPHVLDVMKTLTRINYEQQLACEDELKAIYAKIVTAGAAASGKDARGT